MSRVHDMGGRYGDGDVVPEDENDPLFTEDWHSKALALTLASGSIGLWSIDISRRAREQLAPKDYTRFSYYEKWISALANLLVETGAITEQELAAGKAAGQSDFAHKALRAGAVADVLAKGAPADRKSDIKPIFQTGDAVLTRKAGNLMVDGGHTRLPSYASGARGRIMRLHGSHVLPDSAAHRLGEGAEPLYAVAFPATELWLHPEHPRDEVVLDLWQSYLVPA